MTDNFLSQTHIDLLSAFCYKPISQVALLSSVGPSRSGITGTSKNPSQTIAARGDSG
jgi:hypothetical protein